MQSAIIRRIYMAFVLRPRFVNKHVKSKKALISASIMGNKNEILIATPNDPCDISSENLSLLYTVIVSYIPKKRVADTRRIKKIVAKDLLFINSTPQEKSIRCYVCFSVRDLFIYYSSFTIYLQEVFRL